MQAPSSSILPWTNKPTIPRTVAVELRHLADQEETVHQVPVSVHAMEALRRPCCRALKNAFHNAKIEKLVQVKLVREVQKATTCRNKEKMYRDDRDRDGEMKASLRLEIFNDLESDDPQDLFKTRAKEYNVTTTHFGKFLVGRTAIDNVIDGASRHNVADGTESSGDERISQRIAQETVQKVEDGDDTLTKLELKSRNTGHPPCAGEDVRAQKACGSALERMLEEDLRRAGKSNFTTEQERWAEEIESRPKGERATPDILFDAPQIICGREIRWIDAKNFCCVPGVTTYYREKADKVRKYVDRFGPGAILWGPKYGYCDGTFDEIPGVFSFLRVDRDAAAKVTSGTCRIPASAPLSSSDAVHVTLFLEMRLRAEGFLRMSKLNEMLKMEEPGHHKMVSRNGHLKKFLERHSDRLVVCNDHPRNPHVYHQMAMAKDEARLCALVEELLQRGPLPVGDIGTKLQYRKALKDRVGGLKKLLERHWDRLVVHDDHPHNPRVSLRGVPPTQQRKPAATAAMTRHGDFLPVHNALARGGLLDIALSLSVSQGDGQRLGGVPSALPPTEAARSAAISRHEAAVSMEAHGHDSDGSHRSSTPGAELARRTPAELRSTIDEMYQALGEDPHLGLASVRDVEKLEKHLKHVLKRLKKKRAGYFQST